MAPFDEFDNLLANIAANDPETYKVHYNKGDLTLDHAERFADAIKGNEHVKIVDFENNNLGPEGTAAVIGSLFGNQRVHTLGLQANDIGDQSANSLAVIIASGGSLVDINIGYNGISPEAQQTLIDAVNASKTMLYFTASDEMEEQVEATCERNHDIASELADKILIDVGDLEALDLIEIQEREPAVRYILEEERDNNINRVDEIMADVAGKSVRVLGLDYGSELPSGQPSGEGQASSTEIDFNNLVENLRDDFER